MSAIYPPPRSMTCIRRCRASRTKRPRRPLFLQSPKLPPNLTNWPGLLNQLPPDARKAVVDAFAAIKPNLDQLFDRVLGIPGVGAIIKPTVDAIRAKLDTLATG